MTPTPPPAPFTAAPAEPLRQRVHLDDHAELLAQAVELPGDGEHPTLALARRVSPEGASRGPVVLVHGFAQNRYTWDCTDRSMAAWLAWALRSFWASKDTFWAGKTDSIKAGASRSAPSTSPNFAITGRR